MAMPCTRFKTCMNLVLGVAGCASLFEPVPSSNAPHYGDEIGPFPCCPLLSFPEPCSIVEKRAAFAIYPIIPDYLQALRLSLPVPNKASSRDGPLLIRGNLATHQRKQLPIMVSPFSLVYCMSCHPPPLPGSSKQHEG